MKLTFEQFVDICPQGYSDWAVGMFEDLGVTMHGTVYMIYSHLTEEQKAELKKYENVRLTNCWKPYAPEIRYDVVFIGNFVKGENDDCT